MMRVLVSIWAVFLFIGPILADDAPTDSVAVPGVGEKRITSEQARNLRSEVLLRRTVGE